MDNPTIIARCKCGAVGITLMLTAGTFKRYAADLDEAFRDGCSVEIVPVDTANALISSQGRACRCPEPEPAQPTLL